MYKKWDCTDLAAKDIAIDQNETRHFLGVRIELQNFQEVLAIKYFFQALKVDFIWKLTSRPTR